MNQLEQRLKEKAVYTDHGFIFAARNGSPLDQHNLVRRHFKTILKEAELPDVRMYDLRHTCATLLLLVGENPKVVSERLGHSTITLTMDTYSHVLPEMQQAAAEKLEGMLFGCERAILRTETVPLPESPLASLSEAAPVSTSSGLQSR